MGLLPKGKSRKTKRQLRNRARGRRSCNGAQAGLSSNGDHQILGEAGQRNHRTAGIGTDLWRSSSPSHLLKQVH